MSTGITLPNGTFMTRCALCGIPLDSKYFDESSVAPAPNLGEAVVLARFELPSQYCGILEYFSQFTDVFGKNNSKIRTPGLEWTVLSNGQPLYPYLRLDRILNPWGFGSFPIALRLNENATIELVVSRVSDGTAGDRITEIGGRIVGRYWYNAAYGDVERSRFS